MGSIAAPAGLVRILASLTLRTAAGPLERIALRPHCTPGPAPLFGVAALMITTVHHAERDLM